MFDAGLRGVWGKLFGSLEYDRLLRTIAATRSELDVEYLEWKEAHNNDLMAPWAKAAEGLLTKAQNNLQGWQLESGWDAVLAAQRYMLSNPDKIDRIDRVKIILCRELKKIDGWRAEAIKDLVLKFDQSGGCNNQSNVSYIVDAIALRDDSSQNTWYKISLRRRHLVLLCLILWAALAICFAGSLFGMLPEFLDKSSLVAAVLIFGVLGASVSVAQSLVDDRINSRIPMQQVGSFLIWMRPGIGAAAALVVLAILKANIQLKILQADAVGDPVIVALAFAAGLSERFIVGAVDRFTGVILGGERKG